MAINLLEEQLFSIRTTKKSIIKKLENETDQKTIEELKNQIDELTEMEKETLSELGV